MPSPLIVCLCHKPTKPTYIYNSRNHTSSRCKHTQIHTLVWYHCKHQDVWHNLLKHLLHLGNVRPVNHPHLRQKRKLLNAALRNWANSKKKRGEQCCVLKTNDLYRPVHVATLYPASTNHIAGTQLFGCMTAGQKWEFVHLPSFFSSGDPCPLQHPQAGRPLCLKK